MIDIQSTYWKWREKAVEDVKLYQELLSIEEDSSEIRERFGRDLEFGTGGLRGIMGAGTNRINRYTVARATQGYANYLLRYHDAPVVAIAYDSRIDSDTFAQIAAATFAVNRISVWLYPHPMPTPALSFAIRDFACSGGVVITASHNSARYNGYKVYHSDGGQITSAMAKSIQQEIEAVNPFADVKSGTFEEGMREGLIHVIGEDAIERYLNAVRKTSLLPSTISRDISVVYTPLNGTGIFCVPRCLRESGFSNIVIPEEQRNLDGYFPTCLIPNPEIPEAMEVGIRQMERTKSELLLATDPDCDRIGVAVREETGVRLLNGNEVGLLLFDFVCLRRMENGTMPQRPLAFKTIVTVPLASKIAARYGVELLDTLTGFKYIGEQISRLEARGEAGRFLFGFEESCGYLSGSYVRDKDGVNAALLACEMFAYHKAHGRTLTEALEELYGTYGFQICRQKSVAFEGIDGMAHMSAIMDRLRTQTPKSFAGVSVERMEDYLRDDLTGLPKSNVLRFFLRGGSEVTVRPSGTEPKLKFYLTASGETGQESLSLVSTMEQECASWSR